jgi:hypothetical protein
LPGDVVGAIFGDESDFKTSIQRGVSDLIVDAALAVTSSEEMRDKCDSQFKRVSN